ncbi:Metalloprotease MmpA [Methylobacterium hispanicum]|uniref:Metalloprotease MmpA n=1 Tax=Methylobacterium hispanicum TaxID=270350 RepID=A0AAV4ZHN2_9HYPH|nr:M50 family metallopeptidase [Methylobacterium hispanicum]GJD87702.1 Metalloprotease MmpA [Methylobacterium hispanicum]
MFETLLATAAYVFLISTVVGIHELGHYLAGRALGVQPVELSIGFGRLLFSRTDARGCRWAFRAIPMGGYVKFLGDRDAASSGSVEVPEAQRRRTMAGAGPGPRAIIAFAGPFANFVLTFVVLTGLYSGVGRLYTPAVVEGVLPGSAAEAAGFRTGDRIVAVGGVAVSRFEDMQSLIVARAGMPTAVEILREGSGLTLNATPAATQVEDNFGRRREIGRIGLKGGARVFETVPVASAFAYGISDMAFLARQIGQILRETLVGERPVDQLAGPARIAEAAGDAMRSGWANLLFLVAFFSINLGLMNLLPIPIMDGGLIALCGVEALRGRPLGEKAQRVVTATGLVMVGCLMLVVVVNDFRYLISRL